MSHDLASPDQSRAQDTLRWGGRTSLSWVSLAAQTVGQNDLGSAVRRASKLGVQLVNAHWRFPLAWRSLVLLVPQFGPSETQTFNITIAWTVGSGDAQITFPIEYSLASGALGYQAIVDPGVPLPACDIQGRLVSITPNSETGAVDTDFLEVGMFVAPETEPHATLQMLECLGKMCGGADGAGARGGGWMPPGFYPERLGYDR